jgi:hypothetical protein
MQQGPAMVALSRMIEEAIFGFIRAQSSSKVPQAILIRTIWVWVWTHTLALQKTELSAMQLEQAPAARFAFRKMSLCPRRPAFRILVRAFLYLEVAQVPIFLISHAARSLSIL